MSLTERQIRQQKLESCFAQKVAKALSQAKLDGMQIRSATKSSLTMEGGKRRKSAKKSTATKKKATKKSSGKRKSKK